MNHYFCSIIAALIILVVGALNPTIFQSKDSNGRPSGHLSYIWLAVLVFVGIALACFLAKQKY